MAKLLLPIFLMSCFFSFSQEKAPVLPRFSIRGNVGIPKIVSSNAFRNSFSGVGTADMSVNVKLFSDVFFGIGYSYTYFKTQKYFRDRNINTALQAQNAYVRFGYDYFFKDNAFATFSLNSGLNSNKYTNVFYANDSLSTKYPREFTSVFIEPVVGLYFIVDPNFAIGGHISYNYNLSQFNPALPGMDKTFNYSSISNRWTMSMITFGFGFYYGLARKK